MYSEIDRLLASLKLVNAKLLIVSNSWLDLGADSLLAASYVRAVSAANQRLSWNLERVYVAIAGLILRLK